MGQKTTVGEACSGTFGPFAAAAANLGYKATLAIDRGLVRAQVFRTSRAQVIPGAEELVVGDVRNRNTRRILA
eukprot:13928323-Alexandrium_andersonii.AAC.1